MAERNLYDILEISEDAPPKEIQEAYRLLASMTHPDRFAQGSKQWMRANDKMQELNKAYEILSNVDRRISYDRSLKEKKSPADTPIAPEPAPAAPPQPTPGWQRTRPAPPATVRVRLRMVLTADGMGDAADLDSAVRQARDGDSILLRPGVFHLQHQLVITRSIDLAGSGMGESVVVCSEGESALRFTGTNQWSVKGIAFRHATFGHVVEVDNGLIDFHECSFSRELAGTAAEAGLRFTDTAQGKVFECECFANGHGISVNGASKPTLERNKCHSNSSCGIFYGDTAGGTARINYCDKNRAHGIFVSGHAGPELDGNYCSENSGSGIMVGDQATGFLHANECTRNGQAGIQIAAGANPRLGLNRCAAHDLRDLRRRRLG